MKKNFLILILLLSLNSWAEDIVGTPDEGCNCQKPTAVQKVINNIQKKDVVLPIELIVGKIPLGNANLTITHVDGKITEMNVDGMLDILIKKWEKKQSIKLNDLYSGSSYRYWTNYEDKRGPIIEVFPVNFNENGGTLNIKFKMAETDVILPFNLVYNGDQFIVESNNKIVNKLQLIVTWEEFNIWTQKMEECSIKAYFLKTK